MKFTDKEHNYIESDEERESGHEDTRYRNFECENKIRFFIEDPSDEPTKLKSKEFIHLSLVI